MARSSDVPLPDAPSPSGDSTSQTPRRTSFSFLSRSKSTERLKPSDSVKSNGRQSVTAKRSFSNGNRLVKKNIQRELGEVLRQAKEEIPEVPPIIPSITHQPQLQTFGGDNARASGPVDQTRARSGSNPHAKASLDMGGSMYSVPVPPVPSMPRSESADPYARTESMTNRGRYSYASSFTSTINGPRRVRRRKDPTPFNILVVGATSAGKTSFIDFLRTSCALPPKKQRASVHRQTSTIDVDPPKQTSISPAFQYHYLETELSDGERVGLTLWDSESLEKNIVDMQLREITAFIESKFEETYTEENRLIRSPGARDTHIHCVFLVLDPLRLDLTMAAAKKALLRSDPSASARSPHTKDNNPLIEAKILDEALDIQVVRALSSKSAVIPVISKADTVTSAHMRVLKRSVFNSLKKNGLDPLEVIGIELDEEDDESEDDDSEDDGDSDDGTPKGGDNQADRKLHIPGSRDDAISPARSTKTEDSDIIDKIGPGPASRKISDPEPLPPLPLSILTPDPPDIPHNESQKTPGHIGREFPWGFADPYDPTHCDFVRLKEIVLGDWRAELREKGRNVWYENWRTAKLRVNSLPSERNGASAASKGATGRTAGGYTSTKPNVAPNPPRGPLPDSLTIGGIGGQSAVTPRSIRTASPAIPHPIRDVSPAVSNRGQLHHSLNVTAANQGPGAYRGSPTVGYYPSPRPGWRSASAQRAASPAGPAGRFRSPTANSGPVDVTALPPVSAEEVGVAR